MKYQPIYTNDEGQRVLVGEPGSMREALTQVDQLKPLLTQRQAETLGIHLIRQPKEDSA